MLRAAARSCLRAPPTGIVIPLVVGPDIAVGWFVWHWLL
jgi:hypothetical protein